MNWFAQLSKIIPFTDSVIHSFTITSFKVYSFSPLELQEHRMAKGVYYLSDSPTYTYYRDHDCGIYGSGFGQLSVL